MLKSLDFLAVCKVYFIYGQKVGRRNMSEKKKMGRPKIDNPRTIRVEVRFSEDELKHLDDLVLRYGSKDRASLIRLALSKLK